MSNIIATYAQLANGKDTLCDYLADALPKEKTWERGAFANAVKDTYCNAFGVSREFIENWKRNPEPPPGMLMNVRKGLQFIGDGFRQIVPSIWIDIALRSKDNLIISDGRYINEAKAVHNKKGLNILIYREGYLNDDPNPSEAQLKPIIEYCIENKVAEGPINLFGHKDYPEGLEYFDFFIINNSSRNDFYEKINSQLIPFICTFF
jgi:hypothetical protein